MNERKSVDCEGGTLLADFICIPKNHFKGQAQKNQLLWIRITEKKCISDHTTIQNDLSKVLLIHLKKLFQIFENSFE